MKDVVYGENVLIGFEVKNPTIVHVKITDSEGNITYIPGIKIGDGLAYLIDLPFTDSELIDHINNTTIHVTAEEKNFWNNKNRVFISPQDEENLIFTTQ